MTDVRKVSAGAGAEWLLGGFGLLRKAPGGLAGIGAVFGLISALPLMLMGATGAFFGLQVLTLLITPVLLGGFVYAVREVDQDRATSPVHLFEGFRGGRTFPLMAQIVPQFVFGVAAVVLLMVMIGVDQLQALSAAMEQSGGASEPAFPDMPAGRLLLWMLIVFLLVIAVYFYTFIASPQIMFEGRPAFQAMGRSFRACLRNVPAMLVFFVLLVLVAVLMSIASQVVTALVGAALGVTVGMVVGQVVLMAALMPVVVGAIYTAWRQMAAPADDTRDAQTAPSSSGIEL